MVSTHLKNIRQIGSLPQIGVKINNKALLRPYFYQPCQLVMASNSAFQLFSLGGCWAELKEDLSLSEVFPFQVLRT